VLKRVHDASLGRLENWRERAYRPLLLGTRGAFAVQEEEGADKADREYGFEELLLSRDELREVRGRQGRGDRGNSRGLQRISSFVLHVLLLLLLFGGGGAAGRRVLREFCITMLMSVADALPCLWCVWGCQAVSEGRALHGFVEAGPIDFPPTYRTRKDCDLGDYDEVRHHSLLLQGLSRHTDAWWRWGGSSPSHCCLLSRP
jgi:hypothetical protein